MADKLTWTYTGPPIDGASVDVDGDVVDVGPEVRELTLPSLDPGPHEIFVEARNAAGVGTSEPLTIVVPPPPDPDPDPPLEAPARPSNLRVVPVAPAPGEAAVLTRADLAHVGCFVMPGVPGVDMGWGHGLAHRYVDGTLRFFSYGHNPTAPASVVEVEAPAALAPLPQDGNYAALVRVWGQVAQGAPTQGLTGLHWDPTDARLYWSGGHPYNTDAPRAPSFGYALLDDPTGVVTKVGPWALADRSTKMANSGLLAIPPRFEERYCKGRRLAAGFGGYQSIITTGPASMGPALTAFDPSSLGSGDVPHTPLVGYPFHQGPPYTTPMRCRRDPDYRSEYAADWPPKDGVGYWIWNDGTFGLMPGAWVDTPTKAGVLFFPTMGTGRAWYEFSRLNTEGRRHAMYLYDPADLAKVARGDVAESDIQPVDFWTVEYPGCAYPLNGDLISQVVTGATYDAATRTIWIAIRHGWKGNLFAGNVVHGYRVI